MSLTTELKATQLIWQKYCLVSSPQNVEVLKKDYHQLTSLFKEALSADETIKIAVLEKKFLKTITANSSNADLLSRVRNSSEKLLNCFNVTCPGRQLSVEKALQWIQDNNILDDEIVFRLAKRVAMNYPTESAEKFNSFPIQNNIYRYKFAKVIAKTSGFACSKNLQSFNLEEYHQKLFTHAAKSSPIGTISSIGNYKLSESKRYKAALKIVKNNPKAVAENFQRFQFSEDRKRTNLALKLASVDGEAVIANFEGFQISNPIDAAKVAVASFHHNPKACVKFIDRLHKLSEETRFELLKIALSRDPTKALKLFHDSKITNPDYRFEIAKIVALKNSWDMLHDVQQWEILGEENNFILAKICAEREPLLTAIHIKNFQLASPDKLNAVLQMCARFGSPRVLNELSNFAVPDENKIEAATAALKASPTEFIQTMDTLRFSPALKIQLYNLGVYHIFMTLLDKRESVVQRGLDSSCDTQLEKNVWLKRALENQETEDLPSWIKAKKDFTEKKSLMQWWYSFQGGLELIGKTSPQLESKFLTAMKQLPNTLLVGKLTAQFLKLFENPDERLKKFTSLMEKNQGPGFLELALYLVETTLYQAGKTEPNLEEVIKSLAKNELFKETRNFQFFLFTLDAIVKDPEFTQLEKNNLLTIFSQSKQDQLWSSVMQVNELILYGYKEKLKAVKNFQDLKKEYNEALAQNFNFYQPIDNFSEKYLARFQDLTTTKYDIFLLAQRFSLLPLIEKKEANQALRVLLCNMINGTLNEFRYNSKTNAHLKTIFSYGEDVERLWRQNDSVNIISSTCPLGAELVVEETDNPQELLQIGSLGNSKLSVMDDPHWSQCLLACCLDGKYKAIVVKSQNRIVGSCLLRLMFNDDEDDKSKRPLIFREKIYSSENDPALEALIKKAVQNCGQRMNISVVSAGMDGQMGINAKSLEGVFYKEWVEGLYKAEPVSNPYVITHCSEE